MAKLPPICLLALLATGCVAEAGETAAHADAPLRFAPGVALEDTAATTANAALGDLDGDGDLDLVLARGRHWPLTDRVLLNDGEGRFTRVADLPGPADRTYTAGLADLDGDGDLDVFVGNDRPDAQALYLNDGQARFTAAGSFGEGEWHTRNLTAADLDGDGLTDIVVANRGGPQNISDNFICRNRGGDIR